VSGLLSRSLPSRNILVLVPGNLTLNVTGVSENGVPCHHFSVSVAGSLNVLALSCVFLFYGVLVLDTRVLCNFCLIPLTKETKMKEVLVRCGEFMVSMDIYLLLLSEITSVNIFKPTADSGDHLEVAVRVTVTISTLQLHVAVILFHVKISPMMNYPRCTECIGLKHHRFHAFNSTHG
jgi:hypothetical protein